MKSLQSAILQGGTWFTELQYMNAGTGQRTEFAYDGEAVKSS